MGQEAVEVESQDQNQSTDPQQTQSTDPQQTQSVDPEPTQSTDQQQTQSTDPQQSQSTDPQQTQSVDPEPTQSTDPQQTQSTDPQQTQSTDPQPAPAADATPAAAPTITSFTAAPAEADGQEHPPDSLQLEAGKAAVLSWSVSNADSVELTGPDGLQPVPAGATSLQVLPALETNDYELVAIAGDQRSPPATVHVSLHAAGQVYSPHSVVLPPNVAAEIVRFEVAAADGSTPFDSTVAAASGAKVTLKWTIAGAVQALSIDNSVGDVLKLTDAADDDSAGAGTIDVAFQPGDSQTLITYTLTLKSSDPSTPDAQATVTVSLATAADAPPPKPGEITSSSIQVGGKDFLEWFNTHHQPAHKDVFNYGKLKNGSDDGYKNVFDNLQLLTGKSSVPLLEFASYFCILYEECLFMQVTEEPQGDPWTNGNKAKWEKHKGTDQEYDDWDSYFFESKETNGVHASYNGPGEKKKGGKGNWKLGNLAAGDQLKAKGIISSDDDVAAWNSYTKYPRDQPAEVKKAARECDFYKFRGRGLNQVTGRLNYQNLVDAKIKELFGKGIDEATNDELDQYFLDPKVYFTAVREYYIQHPKKPLDSLGQGDAHLMGESTNDAKAYHKRFNDRVKGLVDEMTKAGFACS